METQILNSDEMVALLNSLDENAIIAIDTEGTNIELDYRDGRGYGIGISIAVRFGGIFAGYYPYRHPRDNLERDAQQRLNNSIVSFKGWIAFHNAKFDLVSLQTLGIDYQGKFYDTLLMAHLINETLPYVKSLNGCVYHYLGEGFKKDDAVVKATVAALNNEWHLVPAEIMSPYAIYDAVLTLQLVEKIEPILFNEIPREYWTYVQDLTKCIIKMESRGVRIDTALCIRMIALGETQMDEMLQILGYNLSSPIDLEKLLIKKLGLPVIKTGKSGRPSFAKDIMAQYEEMLERLNDETANNVLVYRGWQKSTSSNYKPYLMLLSPDGRLRPHYKLHGTKTFRLSCEKPALQQIPKISNKPWNGQMKSCFIAEEGYTLISFDYAQLEFRLSAVYGKEQKLIDVFNDPTRDVFTEMSTDLGFNRFDTKTLTYSLSYGGGAQRISNVFSVTLERGAEIRDHFWNTYPGIKKVSNLAANLCRKKGKVQLWSGRYRHFMYPSEESHKAFNSVCQGGAADIVGSVMVRLFKEVDDDNCRMLLQIHDEIVFEIKTEMLDEYIPKIKEIMEDVKPNFGVKFLVQDKVWGSD